MPSRRPIPKTQKELSNEQITPYSSQYGNANDSTNNINPLNRANQLSFKGDTTKPFSVGIQDIDEAIYYYFANVIKPSVYQNNTQIPVPIIYGSPERWKAVQADGYYRDQNDKIMSPLIMYRRESIEKNFSIANKLDANFPHNYSISTKKYVKENAYDNFSVLNNRIPQKTQYAIVVPDYVTLTYKCIVSTYYMEQMNKIVEAINYASEAYWGDPSRFKFRARITSFTTNNTINQGEERLVQTEFNITMYGYIIPDIINKDLASIKKLPDQTSVVFSMETVLNPNEATDPYSNVPLQYPIIPQYPANFEDPPTPGFDGV